MKPAVYYNYRAFVTDVYDGDSITVDIDLGFGVELKGQKVRLSGLNAPEVRGEERERGLLSRDELRAWILNKPVLLVTERDGKGKYGRWLATVYLKTGAVSHNINQEMIATGHAEARSY